MFARNGFQHRTPKGEALQLVPFLPNIHELGSQSIQGGAPGEHFHLTEAELSFLLHLQNVGVKIYEPVAASGEILFTESGDCLIAFGGLYAT